MAQQSTQQQDVRLDFLKQFAAQLQAGKIELPPFPDAYARILNALDDPDLSLGEVANIVTGAPDLCVRILLMANSVLMNRSGVEVTDLDVAVARLGVAAVRNAAVSLATRQLFIADRRSPWYQQLEELHQSAVTTSAIAYSLAHRCGLARVRDNAMLAGLLHNVGGLYLLSHAKKYPDLADEEALEYWGPGIGRAILENWGFPDEIVLAVDQQNLKDGYRHGTPTLIDLVTVSKQLARLRMNLMDVEALEEWEETPAFTKLELSSKNAEAVLHEVDDEVTAFLGIFR